MNALRAIDRSVTAGLDTRSLGTPVAVRAFLRLSADHGHLPHIATEMAVVAAGWFKSKPSQVHALGGKQAGQLVLSIEHDAGQTTLATITTLLGEALPMADVLVLGNHGTLSWEGPANDLSATGAYEPTDPSPLALAIRAAVERSMETGEVIAVAEDN